MLTLAGILTFDGWMAYRDVAFRDGRWTRTAVAYVVADRPRLRTEPDGRPAFDFLWYRTPPLAPPGAAPAAGGLVTLSLDLALDADLRRRAEAELARVWAAEGLPPPDVRPLPVREGTVELAFAGESAAELATRIAGRGPASLTAAQHATFVVELSRDGAALLWRALEEDRPLFHARYDLVFDHRVGDLELRVWCDARRVHAETAAQPAGAPIDAGNWRDDLVARHLAGFELTSEHPVADADRHALEAMAREVLDAALTRAFLEVGADGDGPRVRLRDGREGRLRAWSEEIEHHTNLTIAQTAPLETHLVLDDLLDVGSSLEVPGDAVRLVDLSGDAARVLDVTFHCTVDFDDDLITLVKVRITYEGQGPAGGVSRQADLVFRAGVSTGRFRADLAAPDRRTYRYEAEVYYDGQPDPVRLAFPPGDASIVVLDLDRLGVLAVEVELGAATPSEWQATSVVLEHAASGQSQVVLLDGTHARSRWRVAIGDAPATYRWRASWIARDGSRTEVPWATTSQRRLVLDAPPGAVVRSIQLVAAGSFDGVAQIVAEVRPAGTRGAGDTFAFTGAGQAARWPVPGDPRAALEYEYRITVVEPTGARREGAWTTGDRSVLVVRNDWAFEVRVIPRLLPIGAATPIALLALEAIDAPPERPARTTLALRDTTTEPTWAFALAVPDRHRYRHQLTLVGRDGQRRTSEWQEADGSLLVLRPPA
jgi:hypothetical protein